MTSDQTRRKKKRSPGGGVVGALSSIRLGISLLVVLFVYLTVGSAGLFYPVWDDVTGLGFTTYMVRQHRLFEMTEFEWFHTWFFFALVGLISLNIIVATIGRIPFNLLKLGVWMIHSGIIILAVGSVIYFGTKVEGDTAVFRRRVVITSPDGGTADFLALVGHVGMLETRGGRYVFQVAEINPSWPILSGEHKGKTAYSVSVMVSTPSGQRFVRQMLAGYPQFTEDVIPGRGRVVKLEEFGGQKLVDESIDIALGFDAQDSFWVKDSSALHVRRAGERSWAQRPIHGLPRYNDYVGEGVDIETLDGSTVGDHPLELGVGGKGDALDGVDVRVTGYLRYAEMSRMLVDDGDKIKPVVDVQIVTDQGALPSTQLWAGDTDRRSAFEDRLEFWWVGDESEIEPLREAYGRLLTLRVEGMEAAEEIRLTREHIDEGEEEAFIPIGGDGYAFRVTGAIDRLEIEGQGTVSGLVMEFKRPGGETFTRWVFENATLTRDLSSDDGGQMHPDGEVAPDIEAAYDAGRWASVTIVAGAGDTGVRLLLGGGWEVVQEHVLEIGRAQAIGDGQSLIVTRLLERARERRVAVIIPPAQRIRDFDVSRHFAMIRLTLSNGDWSESVWLPYHKYSFEDMDDMSPTLSRYQPELVTLHDGRRVELMFSREKRVLPSPVALDDFIVTARVGGFRGTTSTVRDWTSVLRFKQGDGWSAAQRVSTNDPKANGGFWYFQSYWEPPRPARAGDPGSSGLNFTGLGVGNRNGVYTQLAGCCLSVIGMIWAWYIKPIIRRKRRGKVLAEHVDSIAQIQQKVDCEEELVGADEGGTS